MMGANKNGEYYLSIEILQQIAKEQSIYFVLALLHDMQYTDKDITAMMKLIEEQNKQPK